MGHQDYRPRFLREDEVTGWQGGVHRFPDGKGIEQERRDLAVALHGDAERGGGRVGNQGILAQLAGTIRQAHADGHVLARLGSGELIGHLRKSEGEFHGITGQVATGDELRSGEDLAVLNACGTVEIPLKVHQNLGHQPVDLIPRGGDWRGDDILAEYLDDRSEEVVVNDLILILSDAERHVLVSNPRQHVHWVWGIVVYQHGREGCDGRSECLLLLAGLLVAAVEGVSDQFWVGGEHLLVEHRGDGVDVLPDQWEGRTDDLCAVIAETTSGVFWSSCDEHGRIIPFLECPAGARLVPNARVHTPSRAGGASGA